MAGTKNIKVPLELEELIKKRKDGRPPGAVIQDIVKDYERLEHLAKCIAEQRKIDITDTTVFDIINSFITEQSEKTEKLQKSIDEVKTIVSGLKLLIKSDWRSSNL